MKWYDFSKKKAGLEMAFIEASYHMYPDATEKQMRGVEWWPSFKEGHRLRWNWHVGQYDGEADGHHDGCDDRPRIARFNTKTTTERILLRRLTMMSSSN